MSVLEEASTDQLLETYQTLRATKESIDAEYAQRLKPYKEAMRKINMEVHARLLKDNLQNTSNGVITAFLKDADEVGVEDWDLALGWIIDGQHWEFIERRVAPSAVKQYMEAHDGELPPGVKYRAERVCIIRKR
jgi:hypothetical protein